MYIQHRFSKCCTRAKPFDFFHLFLALSLPPEGMCFPPPEKQTSTRSARVGGGKNIPGCSSSLKPQMAPNPAILPVLGTSSQHPGLILQPGEELNRVHNRVFNLISFLFCFKEQNTRVKWPPPELCSLSVHPQQGRGVLHKPRFAAPLFRQNADRCCSQSQLRGCRADASQPSGNKPKPWHSALALRDGSHPSV